jgi:hypothetical protein
MFGYRMFNSQNDAEEYFLSIGPRLERHNAVATIERYKREAEHDI